MHIPQPKAGYMAAIFTCPVNTKETALQPGERPYMVRSHVFGHQVFVFMIFLTRPLRDQCSSVPKGVQQSRAKVAHELFACWF